MRHFITSILICGFFASTVLAADPVSDAMKKDRKRLAGTWQVTALHVNGTKLEEQDIAKLSVVNVADGTWSVRSEGEVVAQGTSTLDPTQNPSTIDFTAVEEGEQDKQYLGIYQLKKNTRKLCFTGAANGRPTGFTSTQENQQILVEFKRVKPKQLRAKRRAAKAEQG